MSKLDFFTHAPAWEGNYLSTGSQIKVGPKSNVPAWVISRHMQRTSACPLYPNSDIDCVFRHVCFGPIADMASNQMVIHCNARAGPICGERTGFAIPKKITTPCPPHRVESASSGTLKQLSMSCQLFMTQTSPAGLMARSV